MRDRGPAFQTTPFSRTNKRRHRVGVHRQFLPPNLALRAGTAARQLRLRVAKTAGADRMTNRSPGVPFGSARRPPSCSLVACPTSHDLFPQPADRTGVLSCPQGSLAGKSRVCGLPRRAQAASAASSASAITTQEAPPVKRRTTDGGNTTNLSVVVKIPLSPPD